MRTSSPFSGFSGLTLSALAAASLLTSCYNPSYGNNVDAGMAFHCYSSDDPTCPAGLVCCAGQLCGDQLPAMQEGWCVLPQPPLDMTITPVQYWDFGVKPNYYPGEQMDPMLSGIDPATGQWRCHRDDSNPNPTDKDVQHAQEPNDMPDTAITLSNPLMADPPPTYMGTAYEICPDRTAPNTPDVDVFKFKLATPAKVIIEVRYQVAFGDLDVALFQIVKDPDTMVSTPQRVLTDLTATNNACIEANNLMAGTSYYVVVRGTNSVASPAVYSMNNYSLRVYTTAGSGSCVKKDGGI